MRLYKKLAQGLADGIARAAMKISGQRIVILHNHIFKNAGTTIDWALQRNFGDAFVDHRDDQLMRQGKSYLEYYLLDNKQIKALSSHHLSLPVPELVGVRMMIMMMFRHPIERVTSVYKFEREQELLSTPGVIHAKKYALGEYIVWRMRPDVGPTIRNFHVRKTLPSNKLSQELITEQDMVAAKQFVKSIELLGLVERFDESMVLFEDNLKTIFPSIDLSYVAQNVGQEASEEKGARLERLKTEIGNEIFELLLNNNLQDLQLLAFVEEAFESRISKVKDFAGKLANFRARCAAKSEAIL